MRRFILQGKSKRKYEKSRASGQKRSKKDKGLLPFFILQGKSESMNGYEKEVYRRIHP